MTKGSIPADEVRFYSGSSNRPLAAAIAAELGVPLDETRIKRFSNDNLYIQLGASVRQRTVYIVQSLSQPVNDHLMELLMMLDIARDAAASELHAIVPYYSFGRSDKKDAPRISITARLWPIYSRRPAPLTLWGWSSTLPRCTASFESRLTPLPAVQSSGNIFRNVT